MSGKDIFPLVQRVNPKFCLQTRSKIEGFAHEAAS